MCRPMAPIINYLCILILSLQGSLAGLEELAAKGSMAPNGSMPAVNISGINSVYVNPYPFEPPTKRKTRRRRDRSEPRDSDRTLTPSPTKDSPHRRVRIASRSMSSDTDDAWADCLEEEEEDHILREMGLMAAELAPKHKRTRVSQVTTQLLRLFFSAY